jgi:hypothetical protein
MIHHLTPEQAEKDRANRAQLLHDFPKYAPTATFSVIERAYFYHDGRRWVIQDLTVMTISFANARKRETPEAEAGQVSMFAAGL